MAIRLRVSIAFIIGITLLFIFSASFVPQQNDVESAIGRGIRKGTGYLNPATYLPAAKEILGLNQSHSNVHFEHLPPSPDPDFRLLIGIMSPFWSSARRQMVRNAYNRFPKDLPVDIVFVKGNMPIYNERNAHKVLAMERNVTQWENNTFHDLMHLECEEAIEYGKTYEFFKKIGTELSHKYTHVMKTDDDSFVNIPGTIIIGRQVRLTASSRTGNSRAESSTSSILGYDIQPSKRTERDVGFGICPRHRFGDLDCRV
jgi:hypothetical protein